MVAPAGLRPPIWQYAGHSYDTAMLNRAWELSTDRSLVSWFVGVEVVQHHPVGRWVSFIGQPPHLLSEVHHGTNATCLQPARGSQHELRGRWGSLPSCRLGRDRSLFSASNCLEVSSKQTTGRSGLGFRVAHPPYTPQTRRSPGEYTTPSSATA